MTAIQGMHRRGGRGGDEEGEDENMKLIFLLSYRFGYVHMIWQYEEWPALFHHVVQFTVDEGMPSHLSLPSSRLFYSLIVIFFKYI